MVEVNNKMLFIWPSLLLVDVDATGRDHFLNDRMFVCSGFSPIQITHRAWAHLLVAHRNASPTISDLESQNKSHITEKMTDI